MGEDHRKSFLEQMPGILTGIAAVIASVGGILAYYHFTPSPSPSSTASPSQQFVCGTQLPGVTLFGIWRWSGTVQDATESGIWTFKSDCTYTNIVNGIENEDKGTFTIANNPDEIRFFSKSGNEHTYSISKVFENSFHLSDLKETVSLDLVRQS